MYVFSEEEPSDFGRNSRLQSKANSFSFLSSIPSYNVRKEKWNPFFEEINGDTEKNSRAQCLS
jgi:acetylglutamate synthase